jgi:hypothetical protein
MALQGIKVLVLAPSRAFFTLYQTVSRTGLAVRQLDRDGSACLASTPEEAVRKAVEAAADGAACVLATHAQLGLAGFPVSIFQVGTRCWSRWANDTPWVCVLEWHAQTLVRRFFIICTSQQGCDARGHGLGMQ